jgi:hypothetical protein
LELAIVIGNEFIELSACCNAKARLAAHLGASHPRRDYHSTEYPEEAGHNQAERDLEI